MTGQLEPAIQIVDNVIAKDARLNGHSTPVMSLRSFYPASEWATAGAESIARLAPLRNSGHHERREGGRREELYRGGDWIMAATRPADGNVWPPP